MSELTDLRNLYEAGKALRQTPPVDDDFQEVMHNFDVALQVACHSIGSSESNDINAFCEKQFDWVERMGWHNKTILEALALIASEVGEAVNECRGEDPTENFSEELADICLRVFDLAKCQGIDLQAAIKRKMKINEARGTRGRRI